MLVRVGAAGRTQTGIHQQVSGPGLIPAIGMARGLAYPVAPEQIIVAAKSLFTCCVSFHTAAYLLVPPEVPEVPLLLSVRDAPGGGGSVEDRVEAGGDRLLQAAELVAELEAAVEDGHEATGEDQINH